MNIDTMRDMVRLRMEEDSRLDDLIDGFSNSLNLEDEDVDQNANLTAQSSNSTLSDVYPDNHSPLLADIEIRELYNAHNCLFDFRKPARVINSRCAIAHDLSIADLLKESRTSRERNDSIEHIDINDEN